MVTGQRQVEQICVQKRYSHLGFGCIRSSHAVWFGYFGSDAQD
jgi:hypothetical protein